MLLVQEEEKAVSVRGCLGSLTLISAVHGRGLHDDSSVQDKTYSLTRDFWRFEEKHGTLECRKLLDGVDLMTPEGQERFKSENMKKTDVQSLLKMRWRYWKG